MGLATDLVAVVAVDAEGAARLLRRLLPRGPVWLLLANDILLAVGDEVARWHGRAADAVDEMDPATTDEIIEDWERVYGLPDDSTVTPPVVLADRQRVLLAKVTATGGQTSGYFARVALDLIGTQVLINAAPFGDVFRVSRNRVGDPLNGEWVKFAWLVHAKATTPAADRAQLESRLTRLKPEDSRVYFIYDL